MGLFYNVDSELEEVLRALSIIHSKLTAMPSRIKAGSSASVYRRTALELIGKAATEIQKCRSTNQIQEKMDKEMADAEEDEAKTK